MMIVFGLGRIPEALRHASATSPHCLPLDTRTLRLWDLMPQAGQWQGAVQSAEGQLAAIAAQIEDFCGDWNGSSTSFVQAYVAALGIEAERRAEELAARASALEGLIQPLHWVLGAPLPLPRAWPPLADGRTPAAPVDMAFRVDGRLHVLCLGGTTLLPSQRRYLDDLAAEGARILHIPESVGQSDVLARLGPEFMDPFNYTGLPRGPFRPRPLHAPRPA